MTTVKKAVGVQYPVVAVFDVNVAADAMVATSGVLTNFKATTGVFDIFTPPFNSQVIGGDVVVSVVSNDSGTSTVSLGDSGSTTRYLTTTNLKALARTALTLTGYKSQGEAVRMTLANGTGDATTGAFRIHVTFMVDSKQNENLKTT